ncbi:hypothetical protein Bca52824_084493 [Brassica carinata]|uniref:Uncharacterized protein n=1 Tax=Brassica carinata TaxID=52824 RepID=A0A8X7TU26_BRACI|nr:hypothetical protein Bca52824_084493 [Brassica carinata]
MNQTGTLNRTNTINWPTIIICTILVITGQSIAKLLENYYYLHTSNNKRRATWFQSLLQVIGFPFLHTPLYFLLYPDPRKPNQLPPSSDQTSPRFLTVLYPGIGVGMVFHARLYTKGKLEIPFYVFTLIYTTQLLFTTVLSFIVKNFKFDRWIVISLFFAMAAGALTFYSSFAGEPEKDTAKYRTGRHPNTIAYPENFFESAQIIATHSHLLDWESRQPLILGPRKSRLNLFTRKQ